MKNKTGMEHLKTIIRKIPAGKIFIKSAGRILRKIGSGYFLIFKKKKLLRFDAETQKNITAHFPKIDRAKVSADSQKLIINEADNILKHSFNIFGRTINFPDGIKWNYDWHSRFTWPAINYLELLDFSDDENKNDVKIPWELSRFHQSPALGLAYRLTGEEKYARKFMSQISNWIDKNPPFSGINWTCAMEAAIRAGNWIFGYSFIFNSPSLTVSFYEDFLKYLFIHGRYVADNLELQNNFVTNHYLSDLVGLVFLGNFFADMPEAARWLDFGIKELIKEMDRQVYPDGCDYEAATCYHRLALELFFYGTWMTVCQSPDFSGCNHLEIAEKIFGKEFIKKLRAMFEATLYLLKPNGEMPQIGDNDSGQLFKLVPRAVLDMRYLPALAAVFFEDEQYKIKEFGPAEESGLLFGPAGQQKWAGFSGRSVFELKSRSFPNAGWFVLRHRDNYCLVSCGPNGQGGNGGHAHNDQLGFELHFGGSDIMVDPGTFTYSADSQKRNQFRSTARHNTVQVNNFEQNEITQNIFRLEDRVRIVKTVLKETENEIIFEGTIKYLDLTHQRTIIFSKESQIWKIEDRISSSSAINARIRFHLSPEVFFDNGGIYLKNSRRKIAVMESEGYQLNKDEYEYSPEYGVKEAAELLWGEVKTPEKEIKLITIIKKELFSQKESKTG